MHINKICKNDNEKIPITLTESKVFSTPPPPHLKEHNNKNKLYLLFDKKVEDSEKKEEKELDIEEDFREKAKHSPTTSTNDILN